MGTMSPDAPVTERLSRVRVNESDFDTIRVLGRGGFGEVRLVSCKFNGEFYAMKLLRKHKMRTEREVPGLPRLAIARRKRLGLTDLRRRRVGGYGRRGVCTRRPSSAKSATLWPCRSRRGSRRSTMHFRTTSTCSS